jgi:hypothetical protein
MGTIKSKIDLDQLRVELRRLTNEQALYHVLKDELTKLGWWKAKPRGESDRKKE